MMQNFQPANYKKDQFFVDYSKVYAISAIKKQTIPSGKQENVISYKPYFPAQNEETLVYAEIESGFEKSNKRKLVDETEIEALLEQLSSAFSEKIEYDAKTIESAIKHSRLQELITWLHYLWDKKQHQDKGLSYTQHGMYRTLLTYICNEFSIVLETTPQKVRSRIMDQLNQAI